MRISFFEKVWKKVEEIPSGEVRSYKWIAEKLGNIKLSRAVGLALNKNPYAPSVPCHRVIKNDGSIGGYSKGIKEKIKLLSKEGVGVFKIKDKIMVERKGIVKYFNEIRGEGRIKLIDEKGEFIFNFKDIVGKGFKTLDEGEKVYFIQDGRKAIRVRRESPSDHRAGPPD